MGGAARVGMRGMTTILLCLAFGCGAPKVVQEQELVGTKVYEFSDMEWLNSAPQTMRDLRGQVVLIRFWTETCPYCRASAPALRQLHDEFVEDGLTVVGLYHPKPRGSTRSLDAVREATNTLGWPFPVAIDKDWVTIDRWWLKTGKRRYTSASLLIDKQGIIRYVHKGPEFHPGGPKSHASCRRDFEEIRENIRALLKE